MNPLDQAFLSRLAPYTVVLIDDEYCFHTDFGVEYAVAFNPEPSFGGLPAYWFDLSNRSGKASPNDPKVRDTVIRIIFIAIIVPRLHPYLNEVIAHFDAEIEMFKSNKP